MRIASGLVGAWALAFALNAVAEEGGYFGASAGLMDVDVPGDSPINAGVRGGYRWGSGWGIEGEITTSLSDGEIDAGVFGDFDYSLDTYAAYGTYRTPGSTYFKARLGYLHEEVDAGPADGSDDGLSGGIGIGFEAGSLDVELEYTLIEADINYWSGAIVFRF